MKHLWKLLTHYPVSDKIEHNYAEYSVERNRLANRLEALAEQIEPDYVVPDEGEYTYFIYLYKNEYRNTLVKNNIYVGQVYMSKDTAYKVCELLNNGEVVL